MEQPKFPFEDDLLKLSAGEEYVVFIKDRAFLVVLATNEDIERAGQGYFCMD